MSDKLGNDELTKRLKECPQAGKRFKHCKTGDVYTVFGCAISEATQKPLVLYVNPMHGVCFARPLAEWHEPCFVPERNEWVERFKEMP